MDAQVLQPGDRVLNFKTIFELKHFIAGDIAHFFDEFSETHPGIKFSSRTFPSYSIDLYDKFLAIQLENWGIVRFEDIQKGFLSMYSKQGSMDPWEYLNTISVFVKWMWELLYTRGKTVSSLSGGHNIIISNSDEMVAELIDLANRRMKRAEKACLENTLRIG